MESSPHICDRAYTPAWHLLTPKNPVATQMEVGRNLRAKGTESFCGINSTSICHRRRYSRGEGKRLPFVQHPIHFSKTSRYEQLHACWRISQHLSAQRVDETQRITSHLAVAQPRHTLCQSRFDLRFGSHCRYLGAKGSRNMRPENSPALQNRSGFPSGEREHGKWRALLLRARTHEAIRRSQVPHSEVRCPRLG